MSKNENEGVRIGPISLVTLIAVLLLAVLAMLCVTTANATQSMAQRQANGVTETYAADSVGQTLAAQVNDAVAGTKSTAAAANAVNAKLSDIKAAATAQHSDVSLDVKVADEAVTFTAALESGKALAGTITLGSDGTASISSWKLSTTQQVDEESLWSGSGQNQ